MSRRAGWSLLLVGLVSAVLVVGPSVSFDWAPAPARFSTFALATNAEEGLVFESHPIEADATLAGLSWDAVPPNAAWVRASDDGVAWSEWLPLGLSADHGPDPDSGEASGERSASDPAYFGPSRFVQYRVELASAPPATALDSDTPADPLGGFTAETVDTTGRTLPLKDRVMRVLRGVTIGGSEAADASPAKPLIVTRDQWGADTCLRNTKPRVLPEVHRVETIIIHHAGNNDYSAGQEAKDLVYSICNYHVQVRGWWDIAYNALIDQYGVVYEGRRGGLENPVRGGHTRGFNAVSTGVALLGNYEPGYSGAATPPWRQRDAVIRYTAWKLDQHQVNPLANVTVVSEGSSKYDEGEIVTLNRVSGHRDASATACPGQYCYDILSMFRSGAHQTGGSKIYADFQDFDPIHGSQAGSYAPGTLHLVFTESLQWTVKIARRLGALVYEESGTGYSADITWDGRVDGVPLPAGPYVVTVTGPGVTWLNQEFQLGDYGWPFVDDEGSYAEDNIHSLWIRDLTAGCGWNAFCPDKELSKAEVAAFTSRAMGDEDGQPSYQGYFADVPAGEWYTPFVEFLYEAGIAEPDADGLFHPDASADRATVAAYVISAIDEDDNLPAYQGYFTDVLPGAWYTPYVERAYELEIAVGFADGSFRPTSPITREEDAAFMMRGFE